MNLVILLKLTQLQKYLTFLKILKLESNNKDNKICSNNSKCKNNNCKLKLKKNNKNFKLRCLRMKKIDRMMFY